ncbi:MAG: helix-turn-helix domain-containing protein [Streptosporangiales bacterium]|nr:helix-turn-helix domain-containing protein [Streptosporangiales bacterium]
MTSEVPAVANAVRVMERIAAAWPQAVSSGTLIRELELNRSTCYNILGTLERVGWATSQGARAGWSLGPRLLALTGASADTVTAVVQRELDELSKELGFVLFVVRRTGAGAYAVGAKAERGQGVRVTVSPGDTFPFSAPAIMQAFYAWTEPDEVARLIARYGVERFTSRTVTDAEGVRRLLDLTRERGYGASVQEYDLSQSGVAAPVFDARGRVSMVLCSLAFSSEVNESNVDRYGTMLRDCADRITAQTGGVPPE